MQRARRQWRSGNEAAGFIEHTEGRQVIPRQAARGVCPDGFAMVATSLAQDLLGWWARFSGSLEPAPARVCEKKCNGAESKYGVD
jgi:hypothetical protein